MTTRKIGKLLLWFLITPFFSALAANFELISNYSQVGRHPKWKPRTEWCELQAKSGGLPALVERSFQQGATMAAIDVYLVEDGNQLDQLLVRWDVGASCRNAEYSEPLQKLIYILEKHPQAKLLLQLKDDPERSTQAFLRIMEPYPRQVKFRIHYPRGEAAGGFDEQLDEGHYRKAMMGGPETESCLKKYMLVGLLGAFPKECYHRKMLVPLHSKMGKVKPLLSGKRWVDFLWGWPKNFIWLAHRSVSKIYVTQVNSVSEMDALVQFPVDGIMTDRIDLLGPPALARGLVSKNRNVLE